VHLNKKNAVMYTQVRCTASTTSNVTTPSNSNTATAPLCGYHAIPKYSLMCISATYTHRTVWHELLVISSHQHVAIQKQSPVCCWCSLLYLCRQSTCRCSSSGRKRCCSRAGVILRRIQHTIALQCTTECINAQVLLRSDDHSYESEDYVPIASV
jgi:hypothetical protein